MRVIVEVYREAGGRLTGAVHHPDGSRDPFASTLDLLRVLEALDLSRRADSDSTPQSPPRSREGSEPESEVSDD
jgi:hypothetical protein